MLHCMTDNEKEVLVGKLALEHGKLLEEIAVLEAETTRIGRVLSEVGSVLTSAPQNLLFDRESHDGRFNGPVVKASDIVDGNRVLEITNEVREKIIRRDEIARQLKAIGINL
jgi:hypothetical protein